MKFFEFVKCERLELFPTIGSSSRLYLDLSTNKLYHYDRGKYLLVSGNAFEEDTSNITLAVEDIEGLQELLEGIETLLEGI